MSDYGTKFAESEAILAMVNADPDEALAVLTGMSMGALLILKDSAFALARIASEVGLQRVLLGGGGDLRQSLEELRKHRQWLDDYEAAVQRMEDSR